MSDHDDLNEIAKLRRLLGAAVANWKAGEEFHTQGCATCSEIAAALRTP